jgi:hypothetical protein
LEARTRKERMENANTLGELLTAYHRLAGVHPIGHPYGRVLVEPNVVETPVVVERVVVQAQASYALDHDRPGDVLCKLSLNRLDQLASVLQLSLPRLLVN